MDNITIVSLVLAVVASWVSIVAYYKTKVHFDSSMNSERMMRWIRANRLLTERLNEIHELSKPTE